MNPQLKDPHSGTLDNDIPGRTPGERKYRTMTETTSAPADPETDTMTVTIRDRAAEAPWGVGLTNPVVRTVTISATCPIDGQRRGEPTSLRQHDDGCTYYVDVWTNPCGHVDGYAAVAAEARTIGLAR